MDSLAPEGRKKAQREREIKKDVREWPPSFHNKNRNRIETVLMSTLMRVKLIHPIVTDTESPSQ